jgi:hypothetical protein
MSKPKNMTSEQEKVWRERSRRAKAKYRAKNPENVKASDGKYRDKTLEKRRETSRRCNCEKRKAENFLGIMAAMAAAMKSMVEILTKQNDDNNIDE